MHQKMPAGAPLVLVEQRSAGHPIRHSGTGIVIKASMESIEEIESYVIGSLRTSSHAQRLIESLKKAGFAQQALSVISSRDALKRDPTIALDHKPGNDPADEKPRASSNKLTGIGLGALLGGLGLGCVGGLIGLISFGVHTFGVFATGSPMSVVLTYAAIGAATGVIAGGLIGLRVPENVIKRREIAKRAGRTLITVHTLTSEASQLAVRILRTGGAEEVHAKAA